VGVLEGLVILIAIVIVGGTAAVLVRGAGVDRASTLPDWASTRRLRQVMTPPRAAARDADDSNGVTPISTVSLARAEMAPTPISPPSPRPDLATEVTRLRDALDADAQALRTALATGDERLAHLEARLERQVEQVSQHLADLKRDTLGRDEMMATRQREVDARQEAALDRLRADLLAANSDRELRLAGMRQRERRLEAMGELYARLARLEAAVAAVTNPILLPGEPYAPPAEFLPETLVWDNWKDVGERAFAFADAFNAERISLDPAADAELAAFVVTLRGLLTQSIYPNLRPNPAPAQAEKLRSALTTFASELPQARAGLARAYRADVAQTQRDLSPPPAASVSE